MTEIILLSTCMLAIPLLIVPGIFIWGIKEVRETMPEIWPWMGPAGWVWRLMNR